MAKALRRLSRRWFYRRSFNPGNQGKEEATGTKTRLLVKTGHLRNSIRVQVANYNKIEIGSYNIPMQFSQQRRRKKCPTSIIGQSFKNNEKN
jgi:hypothetical protein